MNGGSESLGADANTCIQIGSEKKSVFVCV